MSINFPIKNFKSYRNQAINLQRKSVGWLLSDMSSHQKGLLNNPEYKTKHTQVSKKKSIHFTLTKLLPPKIV